MDRRDALRYTVYFMGASLSASTVSAILSGCQLDTSDAWKPTFFTEDEATFIRELSETMLPKTKTPGGKEALVDRYLDTIRPLRYTEEENVKFKEELLAFMESSKVELGKSFIHTAPEKRLGWLTKLDKTAYDSLDANADQPEEIKPFYLDLKELILAGYFSSEAVAKEYFAFDPIPGRYDACIPYAEVGKAWAI